MDEDETETPSFPIEVHDERDGKLVLRSGVNGEQYGPRLTMDEALKLSACLAYMAAMLGRPL